MHAARMRCRIGVRHDASGEAGAKRSFASAIILAGVCPHEIPLEKNIRTRKEDRYSHIN
jgi:hypothetical protein